MKNPKHSKLPGRALPALLSIGALILAGCLTQEDRPLESPSAAENPPASTSEQGFQTLERMGFSRDRIVEAKEGFMVDGDMYFSKAAMAGIPAGALAKTSQKYTGIVSTPAPNTLKLAIHSSVTDWKAIIYHAVNTWNSVGTRLHIEVVSTGADITVYSDVSTSCPSDMRNLTDDQGAIADAAVGGRPGASICVNKDTPKVTTDSKRSMVLTHELGHAIGFHHTDLANATQINGTPSTDAASIMNAKGNTTFTLSYYDMVALEILYPCDKPVGGTDLDADGKDDIIVFRPSEGKWYILRSNSGFSRYYEPVWGRRGDTPIGNLDLDNDGVNDKTYWRAATGQWVSLLSSTGNPRTISWGQAGDIPMSGFDYDGDGRSDIAVWRFLDGGFYILGSRSNFTAGEVRFWGGIGDIPVPGIDLDRDGRDELVIYRPSGSIFHVAYSGGNYATFGSFPFSGIGLIPVGGMDMDNNNTDDLTAWRMSSGIWSGANRSIQWGERGDVPVGDTDLDQDGKRDMMVWRPSDGVWYWRNSSTGFSTSNYIQWGM